MKLRGAFLALAILLLVGISGFMYLQHYSLVDAIYMTIITLATVGFTEVHPLNEAGRIFTSCLIVIGLGIVAYTATSLTQIIIEGKIFRTRRLEKRVKQMKDHVIICGYGRIGQRIVTSMIDRDVPYVVIEKDETIARELEQKNFSFLQGNATEDDTLTKANIRDARCLVAVLNSNADNVYVTLTARSMNPALYIIARANDKSSETKLKHAGATRVISPYEIGGSYIANAVIRPNVVEFMEVVSSVQSDRSSSLEIDEIRIEPSSAFVGKMLRDTPVRSELNIIVLSVKDRDGNVVYNPAPERILARGDTLICIGFLDKLDQLAKMLAGEKV